MHVSLDSSIPTTEPKATEDDEGEGAATSDPDKVIKNARPAIKSDGLLSSEELSVLYETAVRPKSAYEEGQRLLFNTSDPDVVRCGERLEIPIDREGFFEPEWTNYTFYWQLSLGLYLKSRSLQISLTASIIDYLFIIDPPDRPSSVLSLLRPHSTGDIHPGLPKMGVSGSDHISLAAEICWSIDD